MGAVIDDLFGQPGMIQPASGPRMSVGDDKLCVYQYYMKKNRRNPHRDMSAKVFILQ